MATHTSYWPFVIMVVVIVAAAGTAAGLVSYFNPVHHPSPGLTVQYGDNVTVNYIGSFLSGGDIGKVFDTSIYSVATNNLTYPKSLQFSYRGSPSAYTWLGVHVGNNVPSGGYTKANYTFGGVITGFWSGMIGMTGNVSRTIAIPVNQAYGPANPACFSTQPLTFNVQVYVTIPLTEFKSAYPSVAPVTGTTFADPFYSWTDYILGVNGSWVTYQNLPTQGERTNPYGLPYFVSAISAQNITVTSLLSSANAGKVAGTIPGNQTVCGTSQFIVSSVNWASGTFSWNFNPEVDGQNLQFVVTVTNIFPD